MGDMHYLSLDAEIEAAENLAAFRRLLRLGDEELRFACARAINRSLGHMRSIISQEIRDIYYVKKSVLDKGIWLDEAVPRRHPEGALAFVGLESPPLSHFSPRRGKTYVSVRVLKAHRARRIQPGGEKKIVATSKGRAAVWIAKGQVMARTEGSDTPIVLHGPSFMAFFRRKNVVKALNIEARRYYQARLEHELDYYNRKAMQG